MIEAIRDLNRFNVDAFKRGTQYVVIWPGGDLAIIDACDLKDLARWIRHGIQWDKKSLQDLQEEFFQLHRNDMIRTIY
ncbi:MAG: hypothetical protein ACO3PJ_03825 [Burkholderiaceae bacterium]